MKATWPELVIFAAICLSIALGMAPVVRRGRSDGRLLLPALVAIMIAGAVIVFVLFG